MCEQSRQGFKTKYQNPWSLTIVAIKPIAENAPTDTLFHKNNNTKTLFKRLQTVRFQMFDLHHLNAENIAKKYI